MKRIYPWMVLILFLSTWTVGTSYLGLFDLDEALYRRLAQEMKDSGSYVVPLWDNEGYHHKTPVYLWTIIAFHKVFDSSSAISIWASRFPSVLFSWATVLLLCHLWKNLVAHIAPNKKSFSSHPTFAGFVYLTALLPTVASKSVLLDPLLVLSFVPVFSFFALHAAGKNLNKNDQVLLVLGLSVATAVKGLIGIVIPAFCLVLFICLGLKGKTLSQELRNAFVKFFIPFFIAMSLSALFYGLLWLSGGQELVADFFIKHHFGRGTTAFEGHSGSIVYHPLVFLLGGFFLSLLFFYFLFSSKFSQTALERMCLSWVLAFIVFFSFMATKLPNYIWPSFMAAAIYVCSKTLKNSFFKATTLQRMLYASIPVLLGTGLILSPFIFSYISSQPMNFKAQTILLAASPVPTQVFANLVLMGLILLFACGFIFRAKRIEFLVFIFSIVTISWTVIISKVIAPFGAEISVSPIERISKHAKSLSDSQTYVATVGIYSPTASQGFEGTLLQSGGEKVFAKEHAKKLFILPEWNEHLCRKYNLRIYKHDRYMILCGQI